MCELSSPAAEAILASSLCIHKTNTFAAPSAALAKSEDERYTR